ncbi:hypothetical protein Gocc_3005 [Gaiella occulta]|uniref:Uncharacterized protein n=1 Tax=Gaiella occulta TaxID=1002870 RepID=A0A7M2YTY5_9ACTN|nr:hypothetical protein Gocc_3005 [Gaiella occulta]
MRPSASWPTPVRAVRGPSWLEVNASPARNTGAPSRTIWGPPPMAETTPGQSGLKMRRAVTVEPTAASAVSAAADEPRATSTAPPAGIGTAPPSARVSTTGACRSAFGTAAGKGNRITATDPGSAGVCGPHACV